MYLQAYYSHERYWLASSCAEAGEEISFPAYCRLQATRSDLSLASVMAAKDVETVEGGDQSPHPIKESALPPAWRDVYSGEKFKVSTLFPPLSWLPRYIRSMKGNPTASDQEAVGELPYSLKGDFIAGLTVGLMLVPQCLAFALLAGLPVRAGLYSSFAPLVLYSVLGTLRQLQVGPTALISLLTGQALDSVGLLGEGGHAAEAARMAGATQLALLVGLISLALGILRFGFVVDFMSHSVMSSFCTASGVIIATSQLKHVLGISMKRHKHWWETAVDLILKLPEADGATAALGFTLLAFLTFMKAWMCVVCRVLVQSCELFRGAARQSSCHKLSQHQFGPTDQPIKWCRSAIHETVAC